jgi:hypothetical protein
MLPCFRRDFDSFAAKDRANPLRGPSTLRRIINRRERLKLPTNSADSPESTPLMSCQSPPMAMVAARTEQPKSNAKI